MPLNKKIYIFIGWICLILGFIGIFLPVLPTTPFALLAAYFFHKGSAQLHSWLLQLRGIGPLIKDWNEHHVIRPAAKIKSFILIILLLSYPLYFHEGTPLWAKVAMVVFMAPVLIFILTRKNRPQ